MDSSSVNPTQVSFSALDAVLYGLIISKPYTGFLPPKMQFYISSSSGNPTQTPTEAGAIMSCLNDLIALYTQVPR